ncbi:MAG: RDD family protein [Tetrasphaera sp.]
MSSATPPPVGTGIETQYPALAGYLPATLGQRVAARVIENVIVAVLSVIGIAILAQGISTENDATASAGLIVWLLGPLVYAVIATIVMLATSSTIGGLMIGLRHVSTATGALTGGGTFLKHLLEGLVGTITLGIAGIALLFLRPPANQHWADRAAGVVVVDIKRGRDPRKRQEPATWTAQAQPSGAAYGQSHAGVTPAHLPSDGPVISEVPRGGGWSPPETAAASPQWPVTPSPIVKDMRSVAAHTTMPPPVDGEDDLAATMRRGASSPIIHLDNGQVATVDHVILLGRNPAQMTGFEDARVLPVADGERSISKTHLAVGPAGAGVWVQDLHSTNGVRITDPAGGTARITPGERTTVLPGATVTYGDRSFVVGSERS